MTALPNDPDLDRLRRANPVGPPPDDLSADPAAQALLAHITSLDESDTPPATSAPATMARRRWRRPRTRVLALALVGAVAVGSVAYGAVRWSTDDLPAAGTGEDAFVLPETSILPGGYESTRPPLYKDLPSRPSIRFPAGTTYSAAVAAYLDARRTGDILPAGTHLTDPLPDGVISQINNTGVRLDPAAPLGYDLDSGIIATPPPGATRLSSNLGALLPRCQILLGDELPTADPACPAGPARVERYREINGEWTPFDHARVIPTDPNGPTTLSLLDHPVTEQDRVPDAIRTAILRSAETMPEDARSALNIPTDMDRAKLAGTALGARVWAVPAPGSMVCMLIGPRPKTYTSYLWACGSTRQLATRGVITLTETDRRSGTSLWALVADGYTTATIDGATPALIRGNLIALQSKRRGERVVTLRGPAGTRTVRVP